MSYFVVFQPNKLGGSADYAAIGADGSFTLAGEATAWDDLLRDSVSVRAGVTAPTVGGGFRGNATFLHTTLIHTQADEFQFQVQLPHRGKQGSVLYPHLHFCPTTTGEGTVKFILEFYQANVNAQFPTDPAQAIFTKTWTGNKIWYHLIADTASGMNIGSWTLSNMSFCRLYRDNTVEGNYAAPVTFGYIDWHVEIDSFGSRQEYLK